MKKTGIDHPKISALAELLDIPMSQAIGIMECLWHFTAKHSPRGDIGKWPDQTIASRAYWPPGDSERLVHALVRSRMIDEDSIVRLVVHDWSEHCEDSVHMALARKHEVFADGTIPNLSRIPKAERRKILATYKERSEIERTKNAQGTHKERTDNALPKPAPCPALPKPAPKPLPKPDRQVAGVFEGLTDGDLSDDARLADWFDRASSRRRPVVENTEANRLRVFAAAERAVSEGDEPVGLFAWIVSGARWDYITQAQEDKARVRLADLRRQRDGPRANGDVAGVTFKKAPIKPRDDY